MNLEMKDIKELLSQFQESDMCELEFEAGEIKLAVRKKEAFFDPEQVVYAAPQLPQAAAPAMPAAAAEVAAPSAPVQAPQAAETVSNTESEASGTKLTAPLAGIFYRAPKPGEAPYVEVGTAVKKGDTVGLIEAMKIINEVPAPCDGVVTEILVDDATFAQYGEVLICIEENK